MRVLHVYKDYFPVHGGIEGHIQLLAEGLRARGVDARVLVTNTNSRTVREVINGVPVLKTGRIANISSAPVSPSFFYHLAQETRQVDITHLQFPYPPGEISQFFFGRGKHFVVTYQSDIVRQKYLSLLYRPLMWRVLRSADAIVASSPQYIRSSPFLRAFAAKTRVIPLGVNLDRFECTPSVQARAAAIRQKHGAPIILTVGKLRHYKGLDILIRALALVPEAHVLIAGSGPMMREWQTLAAQLHLTERVTFLGELPDSEVTAHYYAADIFVLPSTNRAEAFGLVQVEAMACGLPVVSTELETGTSFVNEHGVSGLVVPPRDPNALAEALNRLQSQPALRREMGKAGQERAHGLFSHDLMVDRVLDFYWDILKSTEV